jgi:hypothetical protein
LLEASALKDLLNKPGIERKDCLLLVLATNGAVARTVAEIRKAAVQSGLRAAKKWNISNILANSPALAVRTGDGWELTSDGKARVAGLAGSALATPTTTAATNLRATLSGIKNADILAFLNEAIVCLEVRQLRAAVVLSWVGAVAVIQDYVVAKELAAFNAEARKRDAKWKDAKTADDLGRMKEHDFLNILESISALGKNVKQELQGCLTLRNSCGHPNSYQIGSHKVASHIESLILNVFLKF